MLACSNVGSSPQSLATLFNFLPVQADNAISLLHILRMYTSLSSIKIIEFDDDVQAPKFHALYKYVVVTSLLV